MDPDLNKYDLNHRVTHHTKMSDAEFDQVYREAWASYYTPEHLETVIRRAFCIQRGRPHGKMRVMLWFSLMFQIEGLHPLEGGFFRRKYRLDRRPTFPIESPLVFYPKYAAELAVKAYRYFVMIRSANRIYKRVKGDPNLASYTDTAIAPPTTDEFETLAMFTETSGGEAAVAKKRQAEDLRARFEAAE
jgi:hypothetical protein